MATVFRGCGIAASRPTFPARPPVDWIQGMPRTLANNDSQFGSPTQAAIYDWPNPVIATRSRDLLWHTWNGQQTLYLPPAASILLRAFDWPLPQRAIPSLSLRTWSGGTLAQDTTFGAEGQTFPYVDWPLPRTPRYDVYNHNYIDIIEQVLIINPGSRPLTAGTYDAMWPNPVIAQRVITNTFLSNDLLQSTIAPAVANAPPMIYDIWGSVSHT